jgi:DNA-binding NarL/FixJ family response regulator
MKYPHSNRRRQPEGSLPRLSLKPDEISPAAPALRRVFIVDDHPMMRAGMVQLIDKQPDIKVCGEANNQAEAFQRISQSRPHLLLSDLSMPGGSGLDFIRDVFALHPGLSILVVSMHDERIYAERALRAGARGYIMKEAGGEKLLVAIRQVLRGQVYLSSIMTMEILNGHSGPAPRSGVSPIGKLSVREFEVLQLMGQGKNTNDIAGKLHLSPKTVAVHRAHIKKKLQLKDATALISYASRWVKSEDVVF